MNHQWKSLFCAFVLGFGAGLASCTKHEATQEDVQKFFADHKIGRSPDYAVVKNGDDYLAVIYGMLDDQRACEDLIKPFNENPSRSDVSGTYSCIPLNH